MKKLVFKVVDHYPQNPFEAWWDESSSCWQVMAPDSNVWMLNGGSIDDATEEPSIESIESIDSGAFITPSALERIIAVALHSDAATASVMDRTE